MAFVVELMHLNCSWLSIYEVICTALCSLTIAVVIHWLWKRRWLYRLSWNLPGPMALPFIGNIHIRDKNLQQALEYFESNSKKYTSPYRLWFGTHLIIVFANPDDVKAVLSEGFIPNKPGLYYFWSQGLGNGLLTSYGGATWRRYRLIMNAAFNSISLSSHQDVVNERCDLLLQSIEPLCTNETNDLTMICYRFCSDVFFESLMTYKEAQFHTGKFDDIIHSTIEISSLTYERVTTCWMRPDFIFNKVENHGKMITAREHLENFVVDIMRKKKTEFLEKKRMRTSYDRRRESEIVRTPIEELLEAQYVGGRPFDMEMVEEFMNLYHAATDPTANTLGFFMLMLGMHQECQEKLYQEIQGWLQGRRPAEVTSEDLKQLPYLDMCTKEVMRLFPASVFTLRQAVEDVKLDHKNLNIPRHATILIPTYMINMSSEYWENPGEFHPGRFDSTVPVERHPFLFLPFSAGPRNCLGQNLGQQIIKTAIIYVLSQYHLKSDLKMKDIPLKIDLGSIRLPSGFNIKVMKRENSTSYIM